MMLTLVVVCHHSSEVLGTCVESFRRSSNDAGVDSEVVVVEQSEDPAELRAAESVGAERVLARPNLGYAAGLNAGVASANGSVLMLANPDLEFDRTSVAALLAGLDAGFDVVGPQFTWDREGTVLYPPAEDPSPAAELARAARRRWQLPWQLGLGRWIEGLWRVWTADGPAEVASLRGPLLVLRRATTDRLGPLDDGYFLYYEETEWLLDARRQGARFAVVGSSRVVHRWGHSTSRLGNRARLEESARERFFARCYGPAWRWVLRQVAGRNSRQAGVSAVDVVGAGDIPEMQADLWLFSTFRHLQPSAGAVRGTRPPPAISELTRNGRWYAVAAGHESGRWEVLGGWTWRDRESS